MKNANAKRWIRIDQLAPGDRVEFDIYAETSTITEARPELGLVRVGFLCGGRQFYTHMPTNHVAALMPDARTGEFRI